MATINYDYYTGSDEYSDGDIENTLLGLVEQNVEIENLKDEEISYPIVYHLSHLRENIINWYPIQSDQTVLEIGAGCGAITHALCKKAKKVVSVELSKRRSLINYTRNKEQPNLEIIVGNLNDVPSDEKFDYVILNGVFEYAMSFTEGKEPYLDFLNLCKERLSASGRLLIAIENRLGVKYFTGAPEDHTKNYLLGLNSYAGNTSVRTFSKSEWEHMLERCGLKYKFYYPYPDYKFPEEIYTDASLTSEMYGKPYINYDADRFEWINEQQLTRTMAEERVIGSFANSFLVEASVDGSFSDVEYGKMSCDRRKDHRIMTVIHNNKGNKWVEKLAADEEANKHIQNILENSQTVDNRQRVTCLPGKYIDHKIVFEYLTEKSLEEHVLETLEKKGKDAAFETLKDFFDTYFAGFSTQIFTADEEFKNIFGDLETEKELQGISWGNLDLVLDNIYLADGRYCVIDCEWIFGCLMPVKFILWRSLNDFWVKHEQIKAVKGVFSKKELFDYFEIGEEEKSLFEKWNIHFVYQWLKANGTEKFGKPMIYTSMDYLIGLYKKEKYLSCGLYLDCGDGYSEQHKLFAEVLLRDNHFEVHFDLAGVENIRKLRFDPIEGHACRCRLEKGNLNLLPVNAHDSKDGWDIFLTDDPMYEAVIEQSLNTHIIIRGDILITDFSAWYRQLHDSYEDEKQMLIQNSEMLKREVKTQSDMNARLTSKVQETEEKLQHTVSELRHTQSEFQQMQGELQHRNDLLQLADKQKGELEKVINHQKEILESIYNSKGWKVLSFVKRVIKGEKNNGNE